MTHRLMGNWITPKNSGVSNIHWRLLSVSSYYLILGSVSHHQVYHQFLHHYSLSPSSSASSCSVFLCQMYVLSNHCCCTQYSTDILHPSGVFMGSQSVNFNEIKRYFRAKPFFDWFIVSADSKLKPSHVGHGWTKCLTYSDVNRFVA